MFSLIYDYSCMETRDLDHSTLFIIHIFIMNILLLNYLVAILSTTYENMQQSGIFKYKVNLYNYCESYLSAYKEVGYGELIMHPPPISGFCIFLIPFLCYKKLLIKMSKLLSYSIFWCENIALFSLFVTYEITIMPITYSKVFLNIVRCSEIFLTKIIYIGIWCLSGIFILSYYMFYDMYNLFKILLMHNGCQAFYKTIEEQKEVDKDLRLNVFNSIIKTMHSIIKRIKFQLEHQHNREELKYQNPDLSFNTRSNATPTVDNKHASFMSKYKSDNEDSKESTFKGEEIERLENNNKNE